ncbi:MAG: efflux RND transporter permease subunit, partial [Chitinophagaceae bacterium]|nr:efflux RND transporter permease subunit [Chitinophagaceae bacterium]
PLNLLADIQVINGPNQIQREDAKRRIVVGFNVRGRDVESIVDELQQKMAKEIKLPVGYYVKYGGSFENLNEAKKRLGVAVPVALLLIFLLLYFAFNSVRLGLLIYSAIPLSAIGGIFFLAARGMSFSISAGVGFIALFGVAVLNGIVLISEFDRLKKLQDLSLEDCIIQGAGSRFRPVLMTAFVAALGFFPMALSNGAGAEVQRPLATVVIGGLLVATLLTLFVLPALYYVSEKKAQNKLKSKGMSTAVVLLLAMLSLSVHTQAQVSISLPNAIKKACNNKPVCVQPKPMPISNRLGLKQPAKRRSPKCSPNLDNSTHPYSMVKLGWCNTLNFPG